MAGPATDLQHVMASKPEFLTRLRLNARQIAFLVKLDEERSVLKAAEAIAMTQPAASKLLRCFEETLEVKLFERHARGVVPTRYGEILIRRARAMLSEMNLAQEEIVALKRGSSGRVSIGTVISPGTNLVPMAVKLVKQRRPGLLVSVEVDYSKQLIKKLLSADIDIVLGRILDRDGAEELAFEPLSDERHAVIARADHPLAGRRNLTLEEIRDQTWILPEPGSIARDRLASVFVERGLDMPTSVVETTSLPVITGLLSQSDMVATFPACAVEAYRKAGIVTVLIEDLGVHIGPFGIVTRRARQLSPGAQTMLDALRETAKTLYAAETC
jgi:DNA-binding transcriptional LysR family regulator